MSQIIPFLFNSGAPVRVVMTGDEPWFVVRDVCAILGIAKPENALGALEDFEKGTRIVGTLGGPQKMGVCNESGLYSLIFKSRKPEARKFRVWVTSEVLPSIRKTGAYGAPAINLNDPATLRATLLTYTEKVIALEATIEQNAPAVEFAKTVRNMDAVIDMGEMARLIKWGRNRLIAQLRRDSILMDNNLPYQAYMDRGYFRVIEGTRERSDGTVSPTFSTRVTGKGQVFLQRRYAQARAA